MKGNFFRPLITDTVCLNLNWACIFPVAQFTRNRNNDKVKHLGKGNLGPQSMVSRVIGELVSEQAVDFVK